MDTNKISTPLWNLKEWADKVYEPSEDSFFLLDTLEEDLHCIRSLNPIHILEIGPGSGIIITALAQQLKNSCCLAVDINPFACLATSRTAHLNNSLVNVVQSDLTSGLRVKGLIDLLVFNPPYVPSSSEDEKDVIDKAWAGDAMGRSTTDRLFPILPDLMSQNCLGYIVALEENKPKGMCNMLIKLGFDAFVFKRRKIIGESLSVLKFSRRA